MASLSKKINKQLFLVFKKLMRECDPLEIQKILKRVIEDYAKNKADDTTLNLTELEPYYADLYQAVEIIALKPLTVYGKNCKKSWKQRKCHEVVTKRLGKGNLDHDFALSIYYWFHVFEGEIWGKRIDENIVRTTHDKPDLQKQLEVIVSQIRTNGLVDQIEDENKSDDIDFDEWEIDEFLDPRNPLGIPFFGREDELEALNTFAKNDSTFLFWAVVGSSGSGKTRLIHSWKNAYYDDGKASSVKDWDLLLVRAKHKNFSRLDWPTKDTLIVIDYVYGYEETLKAIIKLGQQHLSSKSKVKVRLVLIDHIFPETVDGLKDWPRWGLHQIDASDFKQDNLKQLFYNGKNGQPLRLSEISPNQDVIIRKIVTYLAGDDTTQDAIEEALDYLWMLSGGIKDDEERDSKPGKAWSPLFAALVGHALRNKQDYRAIDRRQLIDYYLKGYQKLPWHRTPTSETFPRGQFKLEGAVAGAWIAAATARRGIRNEFLDFDLVNRELNQIVDVEEVAVICEGVVASHKHDELPPFEPDLLGETFFLSFLDDLYCYKSNLRILKTGFYKIFTNGFNDQDAIEFIAFIERLSRNLSYDDQGSKKKSHYWEMLLKFLNPDNFSNESIMRWAVSTALVDVYKVLKNTDIDHAEEFLGLADIDDLYKMYNSPDLLIIALQTALLHYNSVQHPEEKLTSRLIQLSKDFDQELNRPQKMTTLMWSCFMGFLPVVNALLEQKTLNIDTRDEREHTALMYASYKGHDKVVRALLKKQADFNARDEYQRTALMYSSYQGYDEVVNALFEHSDLEVLEVNAQDRNLWSALIFATVMNKIETVKLLLGHSDLNINLRDDGQSTAFMWSVYRDNMEIASILIKRDDIEITEKDREKCGVIAWAKCERYNYIIQLLLKASEDPDLKSSETLFLLDLAERYIKLIDMYKNFTDIVS